MFELHMEKWKGIKSENDTYPFSRPFIFQDVMCMLHMCTVYSDVYRRDKFMLDERKGTSVNGWKIAKLKG